MNSRRTLLSLAGISALMSKGFMEAMPKKIRATSTSSKVRYVKHKPIQNSNNTSRGAVGLRNRSEGKHWIKRWK